MSDAAIQADDRARDAGAARSPIAGGNDELIAFAAIEGALCFLDKGGNIWEHENWQSHHGRSHRLCAANGDGPVDITKKM